MKLTDIKTGMKYEDVRDKIIRAENLVIGALPSFCGSNYEVAENLKTKEKLYVLYDYNTGIITDVTDDYYRAVNTDKSLENIREILLNNGY